MANSISRQQALAGLKRFFRDLAPHQITWDGIHRLPATLSGLKTLGNTEKRVYANISKAETFLKDHRPNDLERALVTYYQEAMIGYLTNIQEVRSELTRYLQREGTIEEIAQQYEQGRIEIPPLPGEREAPF